MFDMYSLNIGRFVQPNLQTLGHAASSFRNGHVGHVGNVVVAGHRVSILTENYHGPKKYTSHESLSRLIFLMCLGWKKEEKKQSWKQTKNTDWDDEIIFGKLFRMSTYTSVMPLCTLGISGR